MALFYQSRKRVTEIDNSKNSKQKPIAIYTKQVSDQYITIILKTKDSNIYEIERWERLTEENGIGRKKPFPFREMNKRIKIFRYIKNDNE